MSSRRTTPDQPQDPHSSESDSAGADDPPVASPGRAVVGLRKPVGWLSAVLLGAACIAICFGIWWFLTRGEQGDQRIISPVALPSPQETIETFDSLWTDRKLAQNTLVTLRRLVLGFGLAAAIGVPLGVLAGCFPPLQSFLTPLVLFGRNIPIAALIPLTFIFFGIAETQKIVFIFLACVAFVLSDAAANVASIGQQYVDTAYTLGAKSRHVIGKVLVPLALPAIFDSLRLLFGLAFGYIMLAETVKFAGEEGGLGNLILMSQRRNLTPHIYLLLLIIPALALGIDRLLYWAQRQLFPHRYGSAGYLHRVLRWFQNGWDSLRTMVFPPRRQLAEQVQRQIQAIAALPAAERPYEQIALSVEDQQRWRP